MTIKKNLATFDLVSTTINEVNHSDSYYFYFSNIRKIIKNSSMSKKFFKNFNGLVVTCTLLRYFARFFTE